MYEFRDHVDNVRLSYTKNEVTGNLEIIEESNYYPFGLKHKGYNGNVSSLGNSTAQLRGFGGKEEQNELGLEWLDFDARNYDPSLGRWFVIAPLADAKGQIHNSPFAYAMNNPVYFIDPDGNCPPGVDCGTVVAAFFAQASEAIDTFLENNDVIFDVNLSVDFNLGVGASAKLGDTKLNANASLFSVELFDTEGSIVIGADSFKSDYAGKNGEFEISQSINVSASNKDEKISLVEGENSFTTYDNFNRTTNRVQEFDYLTGTTNTIGSTELSDSSSTSTTLGDGVTVKNSSSSSKASTSVSSDENGSTVKIGGKIGALFSISADAEIGFKKKS